VVKLVILLVVVATICITKPCHGREYYYKHPRIELVQDLNFRLSIQMGLQDIEVMQLFLC
jgi:hypothetical protein